MSRKTKREQIICKKCGIEFTGLIYDKRKFCSRICSSDVNKGNKMSEEAKKKMSEVRKGLMSGEKHYNWKGGISTIDKICRQMPEYKKWRSSVFERDSWTCQTCSSRGYITAHHIIGFSILIRSNNISDVSSARACPKLWDISNGVTLCEECHSLTDNYKGRNNKKTS